MTQIMKMSNGDNLCKKPQRTTRFVSAAGASVFDAPARKIKKRRRKWRRGGDAND
jgi:hypothetical protein